MKKGIILVIVLATLLAGCAKESENSVLKVGATPVPHAELLNLVKGDLLEKGIELEVVEFTDYIVPNIALSDGQIDANFFQHKPYLDSFAAERGLALESYVGIHVEPLGLYSNSYDEVGQVPDGAQIAIPNDTVNGARALLLLQEYGLLKVDPAAGLEANERDVIDNPHNYEIVALEAAQLPRVLGDVDAAIINGNYALEAGLNPVRDSLILEGAESPYTNIIAVRAGEGGDERFAELAAALTSDKVRDYILETYGGGVVPVF